MTTDTTATKKPTKAQLERDAKARNENNREANNKLRFFIRTMTQGEWLAICRALDLSRDSIADDENLVLLAAAWAKDKRDRGAGNMGELLELTDRQLGERHGFQYPPEDAGGA